MAATSRQSWVRLACFLGVAYVVVALATNAMVNWPAPGYVRTWRLAAWLICAILFATHIAYEHFRLGNTPRSLASHAAVAVAIGGFLLAVAAIVNSVVTSALNLHLLLLALVIWPIITAVPAFLVAFAVSVVLGRVTRPSHGTAQ